VLTNESERQSAHEWFQALNPKAMPLLAVLPNGEICVCWNSTYTDDAQPLSSEVHSVAELRNQRLSVNNTSEADSQTAVDLNADLNRNLSDSVPGEALEESSRDGEASDAAHINAVTTCFSPSDAEGPTIHGESSSIFLNLRDSSTVVNAEHASGFSGVTGSSGASSQCEWVACSEGGLRDGHIQDLTFPVHQAARCALLLPPVDRSQNLKPVRFWATPFAGVQRALTSLWNDSTSMTDSARHSTERAWLQEDDIELQELTRMHVTNTSSGRFSHMHEQSSTVEQCGSGCANVAAGDATSISKVHEWSTKQSHSGSQAEGGANGAARTTLGSAPESSCIKENSRERYISAHNSTSAWQFSESEAYDGSGCPCPQQREKVNGCCALEPGQFTFGPSGAALKHSKEGPTEPAHASECSWPGSPSAMCVLEDLSGASISKHTLAHSVYCPQQRINSTSSCASSGCLTAQEVSLAHTCASAVHACHHNEQGALNGLKALQVANGAGNENKTRNMLVPPLRTSFCARLESRITSPTLPESAGVKMNLELCDSRKYSYSSSSSSGSMGGMHSISSHGEVQVGAAQSSLVIPNIGPHPQQCLHAHHDSCSSLKKRRARMSRGNSFSGSSITPLSRALVSDYRSGRHVFMPTHTRSPYLMSSHESPTANPSSSLNLPPMNPFQSSAAAHPLSSVDGWSKTAAVAVSQSSSQGACHGTSMRMHTNINDPIDHDPMPPGRGAQELPEASDGGSDDGRRVGTAGLSEYQQALADLEAIHTQTQSSDAGYAGVGTFYMYRLELTSADFRHIGPLP
jgi:hypothetical protein